MKLIAFHLPQFHRIPENDEWWGDGFTEWTNVKRATPLYHGHRQPRRPLNNNYYDLSDPAVLKWQAELASRYGIYGFCFYHYWFNGHLLLERPVEQFLGDKTIDLNFCLSWANENWTNGWVSDENRILMSHDFDEESDWAAHFDYLLPFFMDPRYIKEDGKPIFIIYVPHHIRKLAAMIELWKTRALNAGLPGIKFIYQHPHAHFSSSMDHSLFDYGIEFQPQFQAIADQQKLARRAAIAIPILTAWIQKRLRIYIRRSRRGLKLKIASYDEAWRKILRRSPDRDNLIPCAFVDWDNTPRKGCRGSVYHGSSPLKFEKFFAELVLKAEKQYPTDFIFIFAWNEWAEGGYLEPDTENGFEILEAIKRVLGGR